MDEDTVLKTAGLNRFVSSILTASAFVPMMEQVYVSDLKSEFCRFESCWGYRDHGGS